MPIALSIVWVLFEVVGIVWGAGTLLLWLVLMLVDGMDGRGIDAIRAEVARGNYLSVLTVPLEALLLAALWPLVLAGG